MGEFDCTLTPQIDTNGVVTGYCVDCPEIPAVVGVPAQTLVDQHIGWNASARSAVMRTGDAYTQFSAPAGIRGVVCGLTRTRRNSQPATVSHGFFIYRAGGKELWAVAEAGVSKTAAVERAPDTDVFRIERRRDEVRYFHNGALVHTSTAALTGPIMVVACMYAAGDGVY